MMSFAKVLATSWSLFSIEIRISGSVPDGLMITGLQGFLNLSHFQDHLGSFHS